jgi:hypothetical protein
MNVWLKKKWLKTLVIASGCATFSSCSVSPQISYKTYSFFPALIIQKIIKTIYLSIRHQLFAYYS